MRRAQGVLLAGLALTGPAWAQEPVLTLAPGPAVPVTFVARDPDSRYLVSAINIKIDQQMPGTKAPECLAPCTLQVHSGAATVRVTGSGYFAQSLMLPEQPVTVEIQHERKVQQYAGIALGYVGSVLALDGATVLPLMALDSPNSKTYGIVGGVALGVGVTLMLAGGLTWLTHPSNQLRLRPAQSP